MLIHYIIPVEYGRCDCSAKLENAIFITAFKTTEKKNLTTLLLWHKIVWKWIYRTRLFINKAKTITTVQQKSFCLSNRHGAPCMCNQTVVIALCRFIQRNLHWGDRTSRLKRDRPRSGFITNCSRSPATGNALNLVFRVFLILFRYVSSSLATPVPSLKTNLSALFYCISLSPSFCF